MARTSVAISTHPDAKSETLGLAPTLTNTDLTNDHRVVDAQRGDLICVLRVGGATNSISMQGYPNDYGRPAAASAVELKGLTVAGNMIIRRLDNLDGFANANGEVEFNVSQDNDLAFVLRLGA